MHWQPDGPTVAACSVPGRQVEAVAGVQLDVAVAGVEHDAPRDAVEDLVVRVRVPAVGVARPVPPRRGRQPFLPEPGLHVGPAAAAPHHGCTSARIMGSSLACVSAHSAPADDPATIPAPAYRCATAPSIWAQRRATAQSPSPRLSTHPTGPVYPPRSKSSNSADGGQRRRPGRPGHRRRGVEQPGQGQGRRPRRLEPAGDGGGQVGDRGQAGDLGLGAGRHLLAHRHQGGPHRVDHHPVLPPLLVRRLHAGHHAPVVVERVAPGGGAGHGTGHDQGVPPSHQQLGRGPHQPAGGEREARRVAAPQPGEDGGHVEGAVGLHRHLPGQDHLRQLARRDPGQRRLDHLAPPGPQPVAVDHEPGRQRPGRARAAAAAGAPTSDGPVSVRHAWPVRVRPMTTAGTISSASPSSEKPGAPTASGPDPGRRTVSSDSMAASSAATSAAASSSRPGPRRTRIRAATPDVTRPAPSCSQAKPSGSSLRAASRSGVSRQGPGAAGEGWVAGRSQGRAHTPAAGARVPVRSWAMPPPKTRRLAPENPAPAIIVISSGTGGR